MCHIVLVPGKSVHYKVPDAEAAKMEGLSPAFIIEIRSKIIIAFELDKQSSFGFRKILCARDYLLTKDMYLAFLPSRPS